MWGTERSRSSSYPRQKASQKTREVQGRTGNIGENQINKLSYLRFSALS